MPNNYLFKFATPVAEENHTFLPKEWISMTNLQNAMKCSLFTTMETVASQVTVQRCGWPTVENANGQLSGIWNESNYRNPLLYCRNGQPHTAIPFFVILSPFGFLYTYLKLENAIMGELIVLI